MKVARLLVYDGPDHVIMEQMGRSLPVGVRTIRQTATITVVPIAPELLVLLTQLGQELIEQDYLGGEAPPVIGLDAPESAKEG